MLRDKKQSAANRSPRILNESRGGASGQGAKNGSGSRSTLETSRINSCWRNTAKLAGALVMLAVFIFAPATGGQEALAVLSGGMIDFAGALGPKATSTVEGRLCYGNGVPCLNSSHFVRFSVSGANTLFDGSGTARGSRRIQLSNGRAEISIVRKGEYRI